MDQRYSKAEARTSVKTHLYGPREMVIVFLGVSSMENDAPSNLTTNFPSAVVNGKVWPAGSTTCSCHRNASDWKVTSETDTKSLSKTSGLLSGCREIESWSVTPLSFQVRAYSNISSMLTLFDSADFMLLHLQSKSPDAVETYRASCKVCSGKIQNFPDMLRALADETPTQLPHLTTGDFYAR